MPEGVYLDSITTEYHNGSAWVDITNYVVGDMKGNNGLGGWKPDQRVGTLGILNITLNNKAKLFSPMGGDAVRGLSTLTGFNKGAKLRIVGTLGAISQEIWTGRIMSIDSDDLNWGNEQARLMAVDWMNVPVNFPMKGMAIALNKRIDEALTLILARLSIQPESTDFATGSFTFPAVFDNVQRKTMALSEFTKLANSELSYIYVKQDGTLVAENMLSRQGWRALDQVWITPETDAFLLLEEGGFLLTEEGGKIILDDGVYQDAAIHADAESYNILLPEDSLLNASIIRAHPVITDTSLKVLYKLGTPLFIPSGKTAEFSAHYTDPSGLSQVSGTNMQAPVATTDYLANTASDGSGTNKTSDQVVTATYYGDIVYYEIENTSTAGVYITHLQARGYGIYYGNSIESTKDDAVSQSAHGYAPFQFDMKYQKDTYSANVYGLSVIEEYKTPKSRITKMRYLANLNRNHLMCFLMLSIGSLILGTEDRSGISSNYYITDRAFTIKQGGIINVEYGVKQNDSYLSGGLNPVTVEFDGNSTDAINYGYKRGFSASQLDEISVSAWVYHATPIGGAPATEPYVMYYYSGSSYFSLQTGWSGANRTLYFIYGGYTIRGSWGVTSVIPQGTWAHIVATYKPNDSNAILYVNGTARTLTGTSTTSGIGEADKPGELIIGNTYDYVNQYNAPFRGKIFDTRVYNRILTAAEVTTLYNAGVPDHTIVTDGLVFQGPAVYADQGTAASLAGTVLSSTDHLVENIIRAVGIPNGSPTLRANP